ncbi:MAG: alpha/beta hydrolase [Lachnospiraceae bacterium]|nr:alpha/beta hydrolase [Lachnospiraceae bacterium]
MNIRTSDFSCINQDKTIRGVEYLPAGEKLPAVIMSHGFGGCQAEMSGWAERLAEMGLAVYTYDFCGGGRGISDGDTADMTVLTEREDLATVLAYVQALPYTDNDRIVLWGFSQGGFVSALAAARIGEQIRGLVLIYPAFCIPDDGRAGVMPGTPGFDPDHIPEILMAGDMRVGKAYVEVSQKIDIYREIVKYRGNVLIVHGQSDAMVNYNYSVHAYRAYTEGLFPEKNQIKKLSDSREDRVMEPAPISENSTADRKRNMDMGSDAADRRIRLYLISGAGHGYFGDEIDKTLQAAERYLLEISVL